MPVRPEMCQFHGDRTAQFEDPFGHWSIPATLEDVPPDEMAKRVAEMTRAD